MQLIVQDVTCNWDSDVNKGHNLQCSSEIANIIIVMQDLMNCYIQLCSYYLSLYSSHCALS